jgi:cephalosporin hydroxylase
MVEESLSTGLIMGGKDGEGAIYDERFTPYGITPDPKRTPYMSTSCYFLPVTEVNQKILRLWSNRTNTAVYGPQKEKRYEGHGDQGVLNATIYAETSHDNVRLLDNSTWSQHWVFESHVIQWDGSCLFNYSSKNKMRTLHCGGSNKFWTKGCSEKRETTGGSQRWAYAHFLRMLFLGGPAWDKDPALVIPDNQHHLLADFINYHQLIRVMEPDFRQLYEEKLQWQWLHRLCTSVDQHRMMTLNGSGSMDRYIDLVKTLPDNSLIVEAGSYIGGSIVTLAAALLARGHTIWSAESFTGNLDNTVDGWLLPALKKYVQNTKSNLPFLNINIAQLPGQFAASMFEDESIDFMFIDGDHSTEAVLRDIEIWLPKVKTGGILAGDDIEWVSVKQAVEQKFGSSYVEKQSVWHTVKGNTL